MATLSSQVGLKGTSQQLLLTCVIHCRRKLTYPEDSYLNTGRTHQLQADLHLIVEMSHLYNMGISAINFQDPITGASTEGSGHHHGEK
ncbi:hypothetical protein XELAEV_18002845mg [Xenopus laevis]|nr:hypothetical protein XELAEV_18002845mg [Xenopus laevis]